MAVNKATVVIKENEIKVSEELCHRIEAIANTCIEEDGDFKIGVSGGSVFNFLSNGLASLKTDWSKWFIFFCDECVILESNDKPLYQSYQELFRQHNIPIPDSNIVKVDVNLPAYEAARDYICKLALHFPPDSVPRFHCLILGVGPDGHICSLFPNHSLLHETSVWVGAISDSPKPPLSRITFTFPVLNNAKNCIFALCGGEKADIIKKIFNSEDYPASKVKPDGNLIWILDKEAATFLQQ